jgi:hypothetical protein
VGSVTRGSVVLGAIDAVVAGFPRASFALALAWCAVVEGDAARGAPHAASSAQAVTADVAPTFRSTDLRRDTLPVRREVKLPQARPPRAPPLCTR